MFATLLFHTVTAVADFIPVTSPLDPETGQGERAGTSSFSTHIALVEVDEGTGQVRVLRYIALCDVGRVINPLAAEAQARGGVMLGIGYALTEEVKVENCVANLSFATYLIPTFFDVPQEFLVEFIEDPEPTGPFGAKGFAESPVDPVAATIANAVSNAIDIHISRLPMTSERILELFHQRHTRLDNERSMVSGELHR